MKNETARREIESLDYYLQNHTNDYSEESHMAMMMAIKALEQTELNPSYNSVKTELTPREDMRDATEEERKSTKDYIDLISKPTGLQFDDTYEELDFVQPHMKISMNLQPCEDCVSRKTVLDELDKYIDKAQSTGTRDDFISFQELVVKQMPSVTPKARWIPVSEKPQEGRYLCTYEHWYGKCIDLGSFDGESWYIKPIAYMPLPQPYKVESEE